MASSDFLENYRLVEPTIRKLYDSSLRLGILDALSERPMRLSDLRREVNANAPNTSAKVKELEAMGITEKGEDGFVLTPWGEAVAKRVKDSFDFYVTYGKFKLYWETHDMSSIPTEFLLRLGDWQDSEMVKCTAHNPIKTHEVLIEYLQTVKKEIHAVSPVIQKEWLPPLAKLLAAGVKEKGVFPEGVLKVFAKAAEQNNLLELFGAVEFYSVADDLPIPGILCSDTFSCFSIESKSIPGNYFDVKLYSKGKKGIQWGIDIYEHFKKKAKRVSLEDFL